MTLHSETFRYLKPTQEQMAVMDALRLATIEYAHRLEMNLPDGPDKTYILRKLREVAMWVNLAITRNPDGSPRAPYPVDSTEQYPPDHPVKGDLGSVPL